jgi:hypothetical protein
MAFDVLKTAMKLAGPDAQRHRKADNSERINKVEKGWSFTIRQRRLSI